MAEDMQVCKFVLSIFAIAAETSNFYPVDPCPHKYVEKKKMWSLSVRDV